MNILVSCPEIDNITRYLRVWTKRLIKKHNQRTKIIPLEKDQATRKRFCGTIEKLHPDLVLVNGHGNYDIVCGHNGEVLLDLENVNLLSGMKIHAMSCRSAKILGKKAVDAGARCYVGYVENWTLMMRSGMLSNPLQDSTAELFMRPAFKVQEALINGKSASVAVQVGIREYKRSIVKAYRGPIQSDWEQCIPYLIASMKFLKAWGQ